MARTPLTLAALATAAVAGLDVVATTGTGPASRGDFDSALLTSREGKHLIIRVPRNPRADAELTADLASLQALSHGIRSRLPFAVTSLVGQVPVRGTRAVVLDFVYGTKVDLGAIDAGYAASIARAISAIHALPTSFVMDAGLPVLSASDVLRASVSVMDRATSTGLVPAALISRWENATGQSKLWQFQPTVINGSLTADSFLAANGEVTGVIGWPELRIGDPARDLYWLLGAPGDLVAETAFESYRAASGSGDRHVKQRAMLYAELEIAKWLLHGTEIRSTEIVDDAVEMLHGLVDSVNNDVRDPIGPPTAPIMAVHEVEAMLDGNPFEGVQRERAGADRLG